MDNNNKKVLFTELKMKLNTQYENVGVQLDTGADVSCIGVECLKKLLKVKELKLKTSQYKLTDFSGNEVKIMGETVIQCKRNKSL